MTGMFEPYPASSQAIREAARCGNQSAVAIDQVGVAFAQRHQEAVNEAEGDLANWLAGAHPSGPGIDDPAPPPIGRPTYYLDLQRAAVWAAAQMERFADAIDDYNENSIKPRSISKLNDAHASVEGTANAGQLVSMLQHEKADLDAELDACADRIAASLNRPPTAEDLRDAWRAGNLPTRAATLWPDMGLSLTELPYDATNTTIDAESLNAFTSDELADALLDPDLNPQIRQLVLDNRSDAVDALARKWAFTHDTESTSICSPNSSGQIVGPDGRLYDVTVPDGARPTTGDGTDVDYIPDDGPSTWTTITSRDGEISYGDPIALRDQIAYVMGGVKNAGPQAIGPDQSAYLTMDEGHVYLNDGTQPGSEYGVPPNADKPKPYVPRYYDDVYHGGDKVADVSGMVVGVLQGLNEAQQAEYNQQYATEVTFQEDAGGNLRAVVNIYQTQVDDGSVQVTQMYGTIGPNGEIVPAIVDETGNVVPLEP